jgi:hypothetical protein
MAARSKQIMSPALSRRPGTHRHGPVDAHLRTSGAAGAAAGARFFWVPQCHRIMVRTPLGMSKNGLVQQYNHVQPRIASLMG